jgi:hypothetical protein
MSSCPSCPSCPSWSLLKAELSSWSARTKLMPSGYKAELSSWSARTKLMPFGYKVIDTCFLAPKARTARLTLIRPSLSD